LFVGTAFQRLGSTWPAWRAVPILIALAFIVISDLYLRIIPNRITIPLALYTLLASLPSGASAFGRAVLGAVVCGMGILLLALVSRGGIGGGDLKLMVAVGGALGWQSGLVVFVLSQVVALIGAIAVSIARRTILRGWLPIGAIIAALAAVALISNPV
jgi:leader peptidase (prepilin peptidase)/N-methyltransferase